MKKQILIFLLLSHLTTIGQLNKISDSLFNNTLKPTNIFKDNRPLTVSVNFIPKRTGYVSTLKFYKADTSNIEYTVKLYKTATSELLHTQKFTTNKLGWNSINIPLMVVFDATEYTFSLYNSAGLYVVTYDVFSTEYLTEQLIVLDNSGKYIYADAFPESTYKGSNYFLDVVFNSLVDTIFMGETIDVYVPKNGGWALTDGGVTGYEAVFGFFPPPMDTKTEINIVVDSTRYKLYVGRYWRKWKLNSDGTETLIDTLSIR